MPAVLDKGPIGDLLLGPVQHVSLVFCACCPFLQATCSAASGCMMHQPFCHGNFITPSFLQLAGASIFKLLFQRSG
jgi:hypothetical protein